MSAEVKTSRRFEVGDWVKTPFGPQPVLAQIIEDRGPLGVGRRHLYRIRVHRYSAEPMDFEMPDKDLDLVLSRVDVLHYLKEGGLIRILKSNTGGGRDQPRAWLTEAEKGGVGHTFEPSRGLIGGATVPFFAVHDKKVFTPKKEETVQFLMTFGLDRADAIDVVRAVGTSP